MNRTSFHGKCLFHRLCLLTAFIAFATWSQAGSAATKRVTVATLEWPPYTASQLPQGGATTAVLRAAFAEVGYDVEVKFWPWKRAIAKAKAGAAEVVAYFPGYHCQHDAGFIGSEPMGNGPLGFAENSALPFDWSSLDDVEGRRIGTVVGYANTEEFDLRVANGAIRPITSADVKRFYSRWR